MEYVFFSGGFDSTAFLLECLIVKKVKTIPIVVTDKSLDGLNRKWIGRENHAFEKASRKYIYAWISKNILDSENFLLPEVLIDKVNLSDSILKSGIDCYRNGIFTRHLKQVHYFSQIMDDIGIKGNVLGTFNDGTTSSSPLLEYVDEKGNVDVTEAPEYFKFWAPFKLPYIHQTKEEIFERAIKYGYDKPLYNTWSCFYPTDNGTPCEKCEMCERRIIESKLVISKNFI